MKPARTAIIPSRSETPAQLQRRCRNREDHRQQQLRRGFPRHRRRENPGPPQGGCRSGATGQCNRSCTAPSLARPGCPPAAQPAPAAPPEAGGQISGPMVGTFYSRPSPDEPEFVSVGTQVEIGTPVCIIEVTKLFTTIESTKAGTVKAILAEDGQLVDYGQALFVID
ncbi:acetyl-CoA carboxylase biotin carboxyl carrier protein [Roseovarius lutimaris]|nr:biotin/lipoyl-containing protein [Roseovarius lutimaris]